MRTFDELMASASAKLVAMDYLACEAECLEGLGLARAESDFTAYRRALRPLQEARRARRMLAADAAVWIGSEPPADPPPGAGRAGRVIAAGAGCCCIVGAPQAGAARLARARERGLHAEVLLAEPLAPTRPGGEPERWVVAAPPAGDASADRGGSAAREPAVRGLFPAEVAAPPAGLVGVALHPESAVAGTTARHWFIAASEAVGDAALAWAEAATPPATAQRLAALESAVAGVDDHELLHQALAGAAASLEVAGGGSA
ncbi:hypothetical protein [Phycisphaera mikurensis]|uniref:Uncharacterized protein n=1 Tax=Phycisphaera mikurensis (strain NBRC 102666 / KCTC 22515 / FYK2301M01) TaxID=1142394 RepID=I0IB76_PHYMF|nr:hypothetical protein [Phycisphaera mikurensis]MBB6443012.1 hypothetical protein [Phycisphaera mikurensis]BAM02514.1 hypothetical protein PSMK_03550 [Phycisphaera mikurensis NBRC 102666]